MRMNDRKHGHYFRDVSGLATVDVYRVLKLFNVTDPCIGHAVKKLLLPGLRGGKDRDRDVREAIETLERWEEMQREDREPPANEIKPEAKEPKRKSPSVCQHPKNQLSPITGRLLHYGMYRCQQCDSVVEEHGALRHGVAFAKLDELNRPIDSDRRGDGCKHDTHDREWIGTMWAPAPADIGYSDRWVDVDFCSACNRLVPAEDTNETNAS